MKGNSINSVNSVFNRCNVPRPNPDFSLILDNEIKGALASNVVGCSDPYYGGGNWTHDPSVTLTTTSGTGPFTPAVSNTVQQVGPWMPKTAVGDFLKVQYAEVEVRCAITRKMVPAGAPIMLVGGMVISAEAFENWLEEHLSALLCRHQDVHTDTSGYDE